MALESRRKPDPKILEGRALRTNENFRLVLSCAFKFGGAGVAVGFLRSIFLFDAPTRDTWYEIRRFSSFIAAASYPWAYIVALIRIRLVKGNRQEWWTKLTIFFLLLPVVQLAAAYFIAF